MGGTKLSQRGLHDRLPRPLVTQPSSRHLGSVRAKTTFQANKLATPPRQQMQEESRLTLPPRQTRKSTRTRRTRLLMVPEATSRRISAKRWRSRLMRTNLTAKLVSKSTNNDYNNVIDLNS